jgi:hypothetical protein
MTLQTISRAYIINPFHPSVCLNVYCLEVDGQWLGKNIIVVMITHQTKELDGYIIFCTIPITSVESRTFKEFYKFS